MAATEPEVAKLQQPVPLFLSCRGHHKECNDFTVPISINKNDFITENLSRCHL
jgi:hypothetical protein